MSLYRDAELVKELLRRSERPESAERVALWLADPVDGPFVVLSRDGRFVTCLGPGMRTCTSTSTGSQRTRVLTSDPGHRVRPADA